MIKLFAIILHSYYDRGGHHFVVNNDCVVISSIQQIFNKSRDIPHDQKHGSPQENQMAKNFV